VCFVDFITYKQTKKPKQIGGFCFVEKWRTKEKDLIATVVFAVTQAHLAVLIAISMINNSIQYSTENRSLLTMITIT
jgi:hypothetical protein